VCVCVVIDLAITYASRRRIARIGRQFLTFLLSPFIINQLNRQQMPIREVDREENQHRNVFDKRCAYQSHRNQRLGEHDVFVLRCPLSIKTIGNKQNSRFQITTNTSSKASADLSATDRPAHELAGERRLRRPTQPAPHRIEHGFKRCIQIAFVHTLSGCISLSSTSQP
jgi:hypothetical protein